MKVRKTNVGKVFIWYFFTFFLSPFYSSLLFAEDHYRLVITGDMMGAINECDCPGGQPGGLARRKSIFDAIRAETPDAVFIDCGKLFSDNMSKDEIELSVELLNLLDYDIISSTKEDHKIVNLENKLPSMTYKDLVNFDGKMRIGTHNEIDSWKLGRRGTSMDSIFSLFIVIANEDEIMPFPVHNYHGFVLNKTWDTHFPEIILDIVIYSSSGFIEPEVKMQQFYLDWPPSTISRDIMFARPSMYGEYVLVIDFWAEDFIGIIRYEWESIATETYPPDSTFQAKIDQIYKDKVGTRKK